ncbi:uncharacterized protein LOC132199301 isoform X2 [Neocloeon triangulifer]|uniref:uncharacterized protein LOC132199301 isoform X2 n=1 Tax=Neocloeon triangulifer TaxID=2078957 RepID=UPI00286F842B|nr:uncharacterized protein LOC132199301 isoform X2 [Neocloeon triangulifer]
MAGLSYKDWNSRMDLFADRQDVLDDDDDEEEEEEEEESDDSENEWTPSYGFPYGTEENLFLASTAALSDTDVADEPSSAGANTTSTFAVLETIFEENSDDLQSTDSEVDCSYKSDDSSDDDFESVIHVSPGESSDSGSESERDVAVPKKRRKREAPPVPPRGRVATPEPLLLLQEPQQSLSRSSSLLQFECLEQALSQEELDEEGEEEEVVFRTSATDKPFSSCTTESQPPSFSSFSFDSLDTTGSSRGRSLKDSLEDESSTPCSSSSDDESYFLDRHHKGTSLGRSRMRSYRSFDSLVHVVRPLSCATSLQESSVVVLLEEEEEEERKPAKKSSENLSEDSGFGDVSVRKQHEQPIAEEDEEKVAADDKLIILLPDAAAVASPPTAHPVVAVVEVKAEAEVVAGEAVAELNLEEFEEGQEAAGGHTHDTSGSGSTTSSSAESTPLTLVQFNSDLSIDQEQVQEESRCQFYCSAPNLLSETKMSTVPVPAWEIHPPKEITEEVMFKEETSPKPAKSGNKFGNFFQRFSFRKSKGKGSKQSSQEDIATVEAIHSVEAAAAELSNLGEYTCKKERPPLPPVGPPKSRLLGIVGRRGAKPETLATPSELAAKQKIDIAAGSNGGSQQEIPPRAAAAAAANKKASSLVNITAMNIVDIDISEPAPQGHHLSLSVARPPAAAATDPRAKSMEFLLDDENKAAVQPPENELRKVSERKLSEHELRVQRSLQRLDVPEWYKNSPAAPTGSFLLNRRCSAGTSNNSKWPGLNSKTTSLSSLQQSPHLRTRHQTPSASSPSPVVSPSPQERLSFNYAPFSRWSTSRLNSASTSPSGSTRSSFHYRQPYLGWRSQEKLLANTPTHYRTPAERLAATTSTSKPPLPPPALSVMPPGGVSPNNNAEVRSSIKEVTSAIVHYVNEKNLSPARPGRSPSPRGSKTRLWVESSFVGSRPIDQPETPSMPDDNPSCAASQPERMQTGGVIINHANGRLSNDEEDEAKVVISTPSEVTHLPAAPCSKSKYQQYININFNIEPTGCEDNASDVSDVELEPLLGPPGKPKLQDELKELLENFGNSRASPPSATIEDVLDSLLGLPTTSRSPSPVVSPGNSMTLLNSAGRHRDQSDAAAADQGRRSVTAAAESHKEHRRLHKERILQVAAVSGNQPAALKFNSATMTAAAAGIHWGVS